MTLLSGIAVGQPHGRPMPVHDLVHNGSGSRRGGVMHDGVLTTEHPMIAVRALDPHTRLVAGDDLGPAQGGQRRLAAGRKARLSPAQHSYQSALTNREAEQV